MTVCFCEHIGSDLYLVTVWQSSIPYKMWASNFIAGTQSRETMRD